ncbi:hypothetical protein MRX96_020946 [Rhipicephalus microplus]
MVPNFEAATLTAVVTTAGLLGGGGGLDGRCTQWTLLGSSPRLDWEADLVTPGGFAWERRTRPATASRRGGVCCGGNGVQVGLVARWGRGRRWATRAHIGWKGRGSRTAHRWRFTGQRWLSGGLVRATRGKTRRKSLSRTRRMRIAA